MVCTRAAEKCVRCCQGLDTTKCNSKTKKKLKSEILQKYNKFVMSAVGVLCFTEVSMTMPAACSVAVALYPRRLDHLESM